MDACRSNGFAMFRLWTHRQTQGGSIVITSSMSSRIINQVAENAPLTQVFGVNLLVSWDSGLFSLLGILQFLQRSRVELG